MYNQRSSEKLNIQDSSKLSDLLDYLKSEINRLIRLISLGWIVKHAFLFLLKKLPSSTIKLSTERLELNFYKIYQKEEAFYQLKNSKK